MDFKKLVKERRSIKHFDTEHSMHKDQVRELFELTLLSPTAFNLQHWRFTVVENKNLREEIKSVSFNQSQVTDASLLVVISGDLDAWKKNPKKYWRNADHKTQDLMGSMIHGFYNQKTQIQRDEVMRSCSMAAMTLMLAAKNLGYDSC
ncbi:MAG: nitroreductase family protein, partial [Methylophilaceae bacterium]